MNVYDVQGFTLADAQKALKRVNITQFVVKVTMPPRLRSNYYDEHYRVLRVNKLDENTVELLVSKPL